jgi:hypothetical protein
MSKNASKQTKSLFFLRVGSQAGLGTFSWAYWRILETVEIKEAEKTAKTGDSKQRIKMSQEQGRESVVNGHCLRFKCRATAGIPHLHVRAD